MSDYDLRTDHDREREALMRSISHVQQAVNGVAELVQQAQQQNLMNMHEVKSELKSIASAAVWGAIFLLIICVTVLYKSFKG